MAPMGTSAQKAMRQPKACPSAVPAGTPMTFASVRPLNMIAMACVRWLRGTRFEATMLPMPKKLLNQGVTDMVRISDARMSGTSFGTVVLHVAPESAVGGPLAVVRTGDEIALDVAARKLELLVAQDEIEARLQRFQAPKPHYDRGYGRLFLEHVTQANLGCDFDFLSGM